MTLDTLLTNITPHHPYIIIILSVLRAARHLPPILFLWVIIPGCPIVISKSKIHPPRPTFVIVYTGSPSVQESTSSWVFSFTSVSMASLLHTSQRWLYWNQLFRPSPVFARRREVIFLCREQKQKRLGHEASPLLGPPSGTICLTIWRTLPRVLPVIKQRLKSYLFKQCWCVIQPKLTFAATFQLMHLHSSVRSMASKEVTFTLHYITCPHSSCSSSTIAIQVICNPLSGLHHNSPSRILSIQMPKLPKLDITFPIHANLHIKHKASYCIKTRTLVVDCLIFSFYPPCSIIIALHAIRPVITN